MHKKIIVVKKDRKRCRNSVQAKKISDMHQIGRFRLSVEVEGIKNLERYPIGGRSVVFEDTEIMAGFAASQFSEDSTIMHLVEEVLYNEDTDDTLFRRWRVFLVTVILSRITQDGVKTISINKKILHGGYTFADVD